MYSERYTTNWNRERFKIQTINPTNPVNYTLEDENTVQIEGKNSELINVFNFEFNNKT